MDLRGKIVLVTGASSGIGKAIAIAFAHKSAHVLVHYGKNKAGAQETLRDVEKVSSGRVYQADLMDLAATKSLFGEIKRTTPTIDVLINNAGESRPGELNEDSIWEYEYKNILLSAIRTSAEFIAMPSSHLRKIVNITSIYGNLATGDPNYLAVLRLQGSAGQCHRNAEQIGCSANSRQRRCARLYRNAGLGGCIKREKRGLRAGYIDWTLCPARRGRACRDLCCRKRCAGWPSAYA